VNSNSGQISFINESIWDQVVNAPGSINLGDDSCSLGGWIRYFSLNTGRSTLVKGSSCGRLECSMLMGYANDPICWIDTSVTSCPNQLIEYLNEDYGICLKCDESCVSCVRYDSCTSCKIGYTLNDYKCEISAEISTVVSSTQAVVTTVAVTAAPMLLLGSDPTLLWGIANLIQMLYYLLFFNIEYPENLQRFLQIFSLGRLTFLREPSITIFSDLATEKLPSPPNFYQNDFSGLFTQSASSFLLFLFVAFLIYGISKLLNHVLKIPGSTRLKRFLTKTINSYEWSGILRPLIQSYFDLMIASYLQMKVLSFESVITVLSSILGILFLLLNLLLPYLIYKIISKNHTKSIHLEKYQALYEDFDLNDPFKRYFNAIYLIKRMFQAMGIVFLYYYPLLQIMTSFLLSLVLLTLILSYRPHQRMILNIVDALIEIAFLGIHSLILLLEVMELTSILNEDKSYLIGWMIIGLALMVLAIQVGTLLSEYYQTIKSVITSLKHKFHKQQKKILKTAKIKPAKRTIIRKSRRLPARLTEIVE